MPHCGREGVLCWTVSHLSCQVLAFQESKRYQMCLLVNKCLYIFLFLQKLLYCNVMNKQLGTLNNVFFLKLLVGNFVWFVGCVSSTYLLLLLSGLSSCNALVKGGVVGYVVILLGIYLTHTQFKPIMERAQYASIH